MKQEFFLSYGEIIKMSISKFSDEHSKQFLMINRDFKNMYKTYSLFTLFTQKRSSMDTAGNLEAMILIPGTDLCQIQRTKLILKKVWKS